MTRAAVLGFGGSCRFVLERGAGEASAWLMCNPSVADHLVNDPTATRVMRHSGSFGYYRQLIGNVFPLRTPYPAELVGKIERGELTDEMVAANLDALAMISAQAGARVVAFGTIARRYPAAVRAAVDVFGSFGPLYCLGVTQDGLPLHPLARGKFAIRADAPLREWTPPPWLQ